MKKTNVIIFGATGSIGDSVLNVIKQNNKELNLVGKRIRSNGLMPFNDKKL